MADKVNENLRGFINTIEEGRERSRRQQAFEREGKAFESNQRIRSLQAKELEVRTQELIAKAQARQREEELDRQISQMLMARMKNEGVIPKTNSEKYSEHTAMFENLGAENEFGNLKTDAGKIRNISNKTQGYEVDYGRMIEDRLGIKMKREAKTKPITNEKIFNMAQKIAKIEKGDAMTMADVEKYRGKAEEILTGNQREAPSVIKIPPNNAFGGISAGLGESEEPTQRATPTTQKREQIKAKKAKKIKQVSKKEAKTIRVKHTESGQTGTIPEDEFDANIYTRL